MRRITGNPGAAKSIGITDALKDKPILHWDQGTRYTSKIPIDYCESVALTQSTGKSGHPYDNVPM